MSRHRAANPTQRAELDRQLHATGCARPARQDTLCADPDPFSADPGRDDGRAVAHERADTGAADAIGTAGDEDTLVLRTLHHPSHGFLF